jgi:hypothetical protein
MLSIEKCFKFRRGSQHLSAGSDKTIHFFVTEIETGPDAVQIFPFCFILNGVKTDLDKIKRHRFFGSRQRFGPVLIRVTLDLVDGRELVIVVKRLDFLRCTDQPEEPVALKCSGVFMVIGYASFGSL